jgi:glutamyl-tRNA synthetase
VEAYRDELGILPEALDNYLLRLGWGHGDTDIIDRTAATRLFDLADVGRSPSRTDAKKLENLNGHYIREADDTRLTDLVSPRVATLIGRDLTAPDRDLLHRAMPELKPRARDLNDLADGALVLVRTRPLVMDDKANALLQGEAPVLLATIAAELAGVETWNVAGVEAALRIVAERAGLGLGKVAQPLRAALTGRTTSPGIFDVLALLGRDETLARIGDRTAAAARTEQEE